MKYISYSVSPSVVPDEVSLCINISDSTTGKTLDWPTLNTLAYMHQGITCVCLMGGDAEPGKINDLASHLKRHKFKVCWYSGKQELSPKIDVTNFDYIKLGPYIGELGGLNSSITNQRFFEIIGDTLVDITEKFWK